MTATLLKSRVIVNERLFCFLCLLLKLGEARISTTKMTNAMVVDVNQYCTPTSVTLNGARLKKFKNL